MKKLFCILLCLSLINVYGQKQVSLRTDLSINRNQLTPYFQASVGVLYRTKQNSVGIAIDNIGITFQRFSGHGLTDIFGGTVLFLRHLNTKTLSGPYVGVSISYTQFAEIYGQKIKYNETPPVVMFNGPCVGCSLHQFKQLKAVPTFGYEYFPITRLSIFTEVGYGILFVKTVTTEWQNSDKPTTSLNGFYQNVNLRFGFKTVIWRNNKTSVKDNK